MLCSHVFLETLELEDGDIRGLKVGLLGEGFEASNADPEVNELVKETVERLRELGAEVRECSIPLHSRGNDVNLLNKQKYNHFQDRIRQKRREPIKCLLMNVKIFKPI